MRVLHILNELRPSGAETMLVSAAAKFESAGVECDVLSTGARIGEFATQLEAVGYRVYHIPFGKTPVFLGKIFRLMRSGYDAIHLHTERANFWLGLTARIASRGPVLRTIHSCFEFKGGLRVRRSLQRRILEHVGVRHIAISASVFENERSRFGLDTIIIPNWYDSQRFEVGGDLERAFYKNSFDIPLDKKVIVSVGNCSSIKNHGAIIDALSLLPAEKQPLYLHVGCEERDQPERQQARDCGLADNIRFVGALSDVKAALRAADVFIMPSLHEGFGLAAVEAAAVGLPLILTDVSGLRDFRSLGEGVTYTSISPTDIAGAIDKLLSISEADRVSLGLKLAHSVRREYEIDVGCEGYIEFYRNGNE